MFDEQREGKGRERERNRFKARLKAWIDSYHCALDNRMFLEETKPPSTIPD